MRAAEACLQANPSRSAHRPGQGAEAAVTLVIVHKKGAETTDPPKDRYLAFATNFVRKARTTLVGIPKECGGFWGIETGYGVAKQVGPFTSNRNLPVWLILYHTTMILYRLWMVSGWIAGGTGGTGGAYVRSPVTVYRMMAAMYAAYERMIIGDISEAFFAEAGGESLPNLVGARIGAPGCAHSSGAAVPHLCITAEPEK